MSKKNEKNKWRSGNKKHQKAKRTHKPKARKNKVQVDLKAVLQGIYHNVIDLRTTCNGVKICCETAMPTMSYSEFSQLVTEIWDNEANETKIDIICKCIEYFFHYEFDKFGMETMIKPCMLLSDGKCEYYESRPLSCRMYGLWPSDMYKTRVDKFEKAYEGKLTRDEIPLNTQCPHVKRVDDSEELTEEVIEELFTALDDLDARVGNFSATQIKQGENKRTFHDWMLLKIWGEEGLSGLTTVMLGLDKDGIEDQIQAFKSVIREKFTDGVPDMGIDANVIDEEGEE
jgi:Fe-S-cluster containining protein